MWKVFPRDLEMGEPLEHGQPTHKQGARRMASIGSLVDPTSPPACAASSFEVWVTRAICFPTIDPWPKVRGWEIWQSHRSNLATPGDPQVVPVPLPSPKLCPECFLVILLQTGPSRAGDHRGLSSFTPESKDPLGARLRTWLLRT